MARNKLANIIGSVENSTAAKEIVGAADVIKSETRNKGGRKPKAEGAKANNPNRFYLDNAQQEKLNKYIEDSSIPLSVLVKRLLKEEGII